MPSSTLCQVYRMPGSVTFPQDGLFPSQATHHRLWIIFHFFLLNNLSPYRQNGSTGSPTFLGLMHNLQSDARLPRTGRTERLGHLPKSKKEGISWSREKKQLYERVCLRNKGTCWILSSQGKGKAVKYERPAASTEGAKPGRGSTYLTVLWKCV